LASTATTSAAACGSGQMMVPGAPIGQPGARRASNSALIAVISANAASTRTAAATCPATVSR
ncbi:MAG: hypothetical protein ACRDQU_05385, partial [Pseudonocardiaceae bacterium]